jgi:hypothetical protein
MEHIPWNLLLQEACTEVTDTERGIAAIYLSARSSGLFAIGFASSSPRALAALAFTVLPTVFVLGRFTQASSSCAEATRSRCHVKVGTVTAVPGVVTSLSRGRRYATRVWLLLDRVGRGHRAGVAQW